MRKQDVSEPAGDRKDRTQSERPAGTATARMRATEALRQRKHDAQTFICAAEQFSPFTINWDWQNETCFGGPLAKTISGRKPALGDDILRELSSKGALFSSNSGVCRRSLRQKMYSGT